MGAQRTGAPLDECMQHSELQIAQTVAALNNNLFMQPTDQRRGRNGTDGHRLSEGSELHPLAGKEGRGEGGKKSKRCTVGRRHKI